MTFYDYRSTLCLVKSNNTRPNRDYLKSHEEIFIELLLFPSYQFSFKCNNATRHIEGVHIEGFCPYSDTICGVLLYELYDVSRRRVG